MRRALAGRVELDGHLDWLRTAIHDRHVDVRLVLEGLLDAITATADLVPGPPRDPAPPPEP